MLQNALVFFLIGHFIQYFGNWIPFLFMFREWLNELYRKVFISRSNIPIDSYIVHFVCEVPLPPATKQMKIKFHVGDKVLNITRPPKNSFPLLDVILKDHVPNQILDSDALSFQMFESRQCYDSFPMHSIRTKDSTPK